MYELFLLLFRKKRIHPSPNYSNWRWHLDEVFVKINEETHYSWRAVNNEGEGLDFLSQPRRNAPAEFIVRAICRNVAQRAEEFR